MAASSIEDQVHSLCEQMGGFAGFLAHLPSVADACYASIAKWRSQEPHDSSRPPEVVRALNFLYAHLAYLAGSGLLAGEERVSIVRRLAAPRSLQRLLTQVVPHLSPAARRQFAFKLYDLLFLHVSREVVAALTPEDSQMVFHWTNLLNRCAYNPGWHVLLGEEDMLAARKILDLFAAQQQRYWDAWLKAQAIILSMAPAIARAELSSSYSLVLAIKTRQPDLAREAREQLTRLLRFFRSDRVATPWSPQSFFVLEEANGSLADIATALGNLSPERLRGLFYRFRPSDAGPALGVAYLPDRLECYLPWGSLRPEEEAAFWQDPLSYLFRHEYQQSEYATGNLVRRLDIVTEVKREIDIADMITRGANAALRSRGRRALQTAGRKAVTYTLAYAIVEGLGERAGLLTAAQKAVATIFIGEFLDDLFRRYAPKATGA